MSVFLQGCERSIQPSTVHPWRIHRGATVPRGCALVLAVALVTPAQASPISTLTMLIGGLSVTADLLQVGGALRDIFGAEKWGSTSDDHPLWGDANSSPRLTIAATETTFNLLLQQGNNVGEFEDDEPVEISGITKVDTANGKVDAWDWRIRLEADINTFSFSDLDVSGHVQHIRAPHPGLGEKPMAPPLGYELTVTQNKFVNHNLSDRDSDTQIHENGRHRDILDPALLTSRWVTEDEFDFINLRLVAVHCSTPAAGRPQTAAAAPDGVCGLCDSPCLPLEAPGTLVLLLAPFLGCVLWPATRRQVEAYRVSRGISEG